MANFPNYNVTSSSFKFCPSEKNQLSHIYLLLPVCRDPPLSSHQYDITQLPGPQVALHLAEGDVSVGQSSEHALLRTRAWLHRHTRGQRGAAVGRPALAQGHPGEDEHRHEQTQRQGDRDFESMCG